MGTHRTAWHFFFAILLRKRGPRWLEVRDEVPLSEEPLRVDYLLLRRLPDISSDDPGQTLRGLWPRLPLTTLAELKTLGRPYRARNLDRLLGYLHLYYAADDGGDALAAAASTPSPGAAHSARRQRAVERPSDLAGVLIELEELRQIKARNRLLEIAPGPGEPRHGRLRITFETPAWLASQHEILPEGDLDFTTAATRAASAWVMSF